MKSVMFEINTSAAGHSKKGRNMINTFEFRDDRAVHYYFSGHPINILESRGVFCDCARDEKKKNEQPSGCSCRREK